MRTQQLVVYRIDHSMVLQERVLQKRHVGGTLAELLLQPEKYIFVMFQSLNCSFCLMTLRVKMSGGYFKVSFSRVRESKSTLKIGEKLEKPITTDSLPNNF
jgi:hypothetical protein